ncbi:MAG TPA: glycosyltransferase family 2 protein [Pyrinomonadaceae bacterium]|nr:glycosyltransferase family 2 protein [Pyrinomonadaceae bacterium]
MRKDEGRKVKDEVKAKDPTEAPGPAEAAESAAQDAFAPPPSAFRLSVVVPCYNEEAVIGETHARLAEELGRVEGARVEIVYVDDGSRDRTPEMLRGLCDADARVRFVRLSRNFGHQTAVTAGLEHATGEAVVIIDADLQDPPAVIREMVAEWRAGAHVAYGERIERAGETRFKLWTAKAFYRLMNRMSKVQIPLDAGDFRLMDRRVVDALLRMPERDRFVRGMVAWVGFRQVPVRYVRAPRFAGESKYPLFKMLRFAMDGVVSFSFTPLRLAMWTGFAAIGVAFAGILYALLLRFFFDPSHWVRGWASIFVAVLFMGGVQLVSLGIIGEYVGRIYGEVKNRPLYFVRERIGFEEDGGRGAGRRG